MTKRAYTDVERAEAVGLVLSLGDVFEASRRSGVPVRTLSRWKAEVRDGEGRAARIIPTDTRELVAARLWEAVQVGTEQVLAGLRDPKARLGDKASALRIVAEQYALLTGGATARTESLSLFADVGSEAYQAEPPETRATAERLMRDALDEMLSGTRALRLAGVDDAAIALDGLTVRAKLSTSDALAVQALLERLEGALAAGVDPGAIIAGLTAKQDGHAPQ